LELGIIDLTAMRLFNALKKPSLVVFVILYGQ
jgi:hypothetical protein